VRRVVVFFTGIAAAWGLACGITADLSGLQGGTRGDAAAPAEASAPPAEAAVDGAAGFCKSRAPAPKLCDDFDEGGPIGRLWTAIDVSDGQTVALDTVAFSSPGSFLSAINSSDAPATARLSQSLPVLASRVHIEFEMLLAPGPGSIEIAAVHEQTPDGTTYGLFYKFDQGNLALYLKTLGADGGVSTLLHTLGAAPANWMRVDIDFDIADAGRITVQHDGATVYDDTPVPTDTSARTSLFVELGLYSFQKATIQGNFDNVIVDWPN
jgi:hypothetical protein